MAKVRLQQGGLYQRIMSKAEGERWAGLDAYDGLRQQRIASSGDFPAQWLTGGQNEGVREARQRQGEKRGPNSDT